MQIINIIFLTTTILALGSSLPVKKQNTEHDIEIIDLSNGEASLRLKRQFPNIDWGNVFMQASNFKLGGSFQLNGETQSMQQSAGHQHVGNGNGGYGDGGYGGYGGGGHGGYGGRRGGYGGGGHGGYGGGGNGGYGGGGYGNNYY